MLNLSLTLLEIKSTFNKTYQERFLHSIHPPIPEKVGYFL